jgi:hypothetical protein
VRRSICNDCSLLLDDGVDYTFCPACSKPVTEIEDGPGRPLQPPGMMSPDDGFSVLGFVLDVLQTIGELLG